VKSENAALGFRVKSGWATVVLLASAVDLPRLRHNRVIDLSGPRFPKTPPRSLRGWRFVSRLIAATGAVALHFIAKNGNTCSN
jgi:hypothetical protein